MPTCSSLSSIKRKLAWCSLIKCTLSLLDPGRVNMLCYGHFESPPPLRVLLY